MRSKLLLLFAAIAAAASAQQAKYIFYFIGDGMGMGPVMAAETYRRTVLGTDAPLTMMQMPVLGWCTTYSASSPVTDSAAAGTALATGSKTRNSMLGMDADTTAVTSIARQLKDRGYGVGLITTVAPDDATPGAFYAHVPHRSQYYDIGCQLADAGYDIIGGAGLRGLTDKKGQPTDLAARLAEAGVRTFRGREALDSVAAADARTVLLLNPAGTPEWNVGYTIDSIAGRLDLPSMTRAAIARLEAVSPERFFLMAEGGNIDHALHANDAGTAIKETLAFDSAIAEAYRFYLAHPDETLIVVTADHDTGGLAMGSNALPYDARPANFDAQRISKERFNDICKERHQAGNSMSWDEMSDFLAAELGLGSVVKLSDEQREELRRLYTDTVDGSNTAEQKTLYANFNAFSAEVFRLLAAASGFGFTTTHHTGNPVPVFAVGVGSDAFKGFNDNTLLPALIMR